MYVSVCEHRKVYLRKGLWSYLWRDDSLLSPAVCFSAAHQYLIRVWKHDYIRPVLRSKSLNSYWGENKKCGWLFHIMTFLVPILKLSKICYNQLITLYLAKHHLSFPLITISSLVIFKDWCVYIFNDKRVRLECFPISVFINQK